MKGNKKISPEKSFSFAFFTFHLLLFTFLFSLASCGYHPIGHLDPETPSVATISVPTWENRTAYRGIEAVFTEKVIEAITQRGLARVVAPADAEATLQGRIISISDSVASYYPTGAGDQFSPADYQVVVLVNITVTRKSDQKILWQLSNLQEETYYDARDRALMLDSNRRDAIARAAEAIAREVVNRWGGGF
ncbi:MAG: LPS assembly lipoprotein LptE [Proteobacteria bacterium]|nr:LPS assembly lipoprotein LptE [Pseudomonadota bacterium]